MDNHIKQVLDVMTDVGLWFDDSQVDDVRAMRGEVTKGGGFYLRACLAGADFAPMPGE